MAVKTEVVQLYIETLITAAFAMSSKKVDASHLKRINNLKKLISSNFYLQDKLVEADQGLKTTVTKRLKDKKFRHRQNGAIITASEMGIELYFKSWREQKEANLIPEVSSDYDKPNELEIEDLIKIGLSYFESEAGVEEYTQLKGSIEIKMR